MQHHVCGTHTAHHLRSWMRTFERALFRSSGGQPESASAEMLVRAIQAGAACNAPSKHGTESVALSMFNQVRYSSSAVRSN